MKAEPGGQPDVNAMIEKSVAANEADFKAGPEFNHKETTRTHGKADTFQVTMIDGSPYRRLIAVNGHALSAVRNREELAKQETEAARRKSESPDERRERTNTYEKGRDRDHAMMSQLTKAFNFQLLGKRKLRSFNTYLLKATPRPDYNPPNMETQALRGMQGELWLDQKTFQWVKVTAQVVRPVTIEGFLARVDPGTRFELEKSPVGNNIWEMTHFSARSHAVILFLISHSAAEDDTYFDYQPVPTTK